MTKTTIIIPARYGSYRLPAKPLKEIAGHSMIKRMWSIASNVEGADEVVIATDDQRIMEHVEGFGGQAVMTDPACANGSERVFEAVNKLAEKPDIILNLQGDAVLTPPWILEDMIAEMKVDRSADIVTPAVKISPEYFNTLLESAKTGKAGGTTVVFDERRKALYFSKNPIPFVRTKEITDPPFYRHIGLYGYRYDSLKKYVATSPTPLEKIEQLEQLRALETGMFVKIVLVDYRGRTHGSVDNPEDIAKTEDIIAKEGELVELS